MDQVTLNYRVLTPGFALFQDVFSPFRKIWYYLTFRIVDSDTLKISPARLVIGLTLLAVVLYLSSKISSLLHQRMERRAHIDPGLRYTIARLLRYVMVTLGILLVLKQAFALDLTSIAIVFTALSVGIGFGLQYIAADIASGFILLFERPIRIGDRITIGEDEGDVKSINLRTTLVTTNDNISIIVPNSKLVSQRVINWSYGDPRARIAIPVGVAYDADVDLVTETLILAAEGVENVLTEPSPRVQFLNFGDSSMDFRLLVWSVQPRRHFEIRSEINYRIWMLFRQRGIEISDPTTEFRMRPDQANPGAMDKGLLK